MENDRSYYYVYVSHSEIIIPKVHIQTPLQNFSIRLLGRR